MSSFNWSVTLATVALRSVASSSSALATRSDTVVR